VKYATNVNQHKNPACQERRTLPAQCDCCVDSELLHISQDSDPSLHGNVLYSWVRSSRFMIAGASRQQPNAGRR